MAAIRYRRIFTLILFVCLLLGAAAADEILDAPSLSGCLDCGFPEGHDPSCQAYVPDSHVPDVSDSCLECGAVAPEHLVGCLLYVPDAPVEPPVSSEAELPSSDPLPEDIPVEPLSFAEEMLVETSEPVAVYDAKSTDQPLTMTIDGVKYICFDLAAGDVEIKANTYTGYVLDGSTSQPQKKTGSHIPANRYYIYQSNDNYEPKISGNTLTAPPNYDRVSSPLGSGTWGDYITNNYNVTEVIQNWTNMANGRTPTPTKISVTGSGVYNLTIDNIWSSSSGNQKGGITFTPEGGGQLTVHLVNDSRFTNIHYDAKKNEGKIIFDAASNDATLTVASNEKSNHYNSVIGGSDGADYENSWGIIFEGGTVFAGATAIDDCTAIGGGGNGVGQVTINGGRITAVSTSSGTAIGGGIGESAAGGAGYVYINGGEVYAYNFGFVSQKGAGEQAFIPSAAIGGGSSRQSDGSIGQVTITGGTVYAQSLGGTAIGGGSSSWMSGGEAVVSISGVDTIVTAVSTTGWAEGYVTDNNGIQSTYLSENITNKGAGIGGGTAGNYRKSSIGNGGNARLDILGGTVITGSIGGGGVNNCSSATIGNAYVNIKGGKLFGQVMMEGGASTFQMSGGVIDNTGSTNATFLKKDGGAVWIKAGNAQMSGGTINNTCGDKGGAIYVEGGSFTMSGGNITDVSAGNGGAVYVNVTDGSNKVSFTMTGGKIQNSTATSNGGAVSGNGGAVSVENGKASLGGSARITNTTATSNGGAIYVSGGTVTMSGGTISDVSASNGGAIYVNAGSPGVDSFTMTGGKIQNAKATATDNGGGGAVYLSKGNFVMDSGSLLNNNATCNGGGAYVSDGSIIIGNGTLCALEKNSTHSHPIVKDNEAQNGGAFAIFGGTLSVYCGNYSGNNATKSESDSIYQEDGYIYIYKGVDNESLPFNETFILGNTFVYTDNRLPLLTVQLYNSTKADVDKYVSKFVVDSSIYHSIRLNKSLLPAASLIPEDSNPMLIGWSLNKSDTCVTIKENSSSYYPEESKYPVTVGGYVNIYAIWGQSDKNYTIIIPDTIEITDDNNIRIGIDESEPFFIPNEVGRLNINLSQMDSSLSLLNTDISLKYKLKDKNGNELDVDDIVASFTYNQSKNYSNQGVTLTADITDDDDNEPVYAGTYSGIVTFSCSLVIDDYDQDKTDSKTCYTSSSLTSGVAS